MGWCSVRKATGKETPNGSRVRQALGLIVDGRRRSHGGARRNEVVEYETAVQLALASAWTRWPPAAEARLEVEADRPLPSTLEGQPARAVDVARFEGSSANNFLPLKTAVNFAEATVHSTRTACSGR